MNDGTGFTKEQVNAYAGAHYLRVSAQKLNSVAREIRGLKVSEAENILRFLTRKPAALLLKVLKSAQANAVSKSMKKDKLLVYRVEIGRGPYLKRGHPVSRGAFHPILKKTSHVLIELREGGHGSEG